MPSDADCFRPHTLESALSRRTRSPLAMPLTLLKANLGHPAHRFWADELSFIQALEPLTSRLAGHQQVTDAYLLGLAMHKKGKLATMDRAILALLPEKSREREFVELV